MKIPTNKRKTQDFASINFEQLTQQYGNLRAEYLTRSMSVKEASNFRKKFPEGTTSQTPSKLAPLEWKLQITENFANILRKHNKLHLHRMIESCGLSPITKLDATLCQDLEKDILIRFSGDGYFVFSVPQINYPEGRYYFKQKLTFSWVGHWDEANKQYWELDDCRSPHDGVLVFAAQPEYAFNPQSELF